MTLQHYPIVIIGAGLSGLTTAYRLKQHGITAHVFEARQRVGGRILSVNINNHIGELGAENVLDGGECTHILKLIEELKLEHHSGKRPMMARFDTGTEFVNRTDALRQYKDLPSEQELPQRLTEIAQQSRNMAEVLQALFPDQPILRQIFDLFMLGYEGACAKQLSTFYAHSLIRWIESAYRPDDDPVYFEYLLLNGGSAKLPQALAAALTDQIHFGMALTALTQAADGKIRLRFKTGQEISADRVVLALPCGVYKDIAFDAQILTPDKLQHIHNVTYGTHAKILVPMDTRNLPGGVCLNDRFGTFAFNDHLLTMYYVQEPRDLDPAHIAQLFARDSQFIEKAYHITVDTPKAVFAGDEHYAAYASPVGYNWAQDPYARGSYSCIGAGQDAVFTSTTQYHGEAVKQLFAPINDRLFFAGEHTSLIMDGIGTMEAAVEAGERTARLISS